MPVGNQPPLSDEANCSRRSQGACAFLPLPLPSAPNSLEAKTLPRQLWRIRFVLSGPKEMGKRTGVGGVCVSVCVCVWLSS